MSCEHVHKDAPNNANCDDCHHAGKIGDEWNLSDKFKQHGRGPFTGRYVELEDVREFIKRLKESLLFNEGIAFSLEQGEMVTFALGQIDKLAGDKLC